MLRIALALTLAAGLCAPALSAPTMTARTAVVVFDAATMHVTARVKGSCWVSSIASRRSDAYRCTAGNAIHDPCFTLGRGRVACPTDAAKDRGIVISLTKPLPAAVEIRNAWQMELVSGVQCNIGTGTITPGYPFYCSGGLVCSAPPPGAQNGPVFVRCAQVTRGKAGTAGRYLVRTLFE